MLETILRDSYRGITVVEEDVGAINKILSRQIATAARAAGLRVAFLKLADEMSVEPDQQAIESAIGGKEITGASSRQASRRSTSFLEGLDYDLIVINSFSGYFVDKSDRETVEVIREIERLSKMKRNFVITYEPGILSDKTSAFLRSTADNLIVVRTELIADRIERMLYVPKMADEEPLDRLIKITVTGAGVQEDTREFVG